MALDLSKLITLPVAEIAAILEGGGVSKTLASRVVTASMRYLLALGGGDLAAVLSAAAALRAAWLALGLTVPAGKLPGEPPADMEVFGEEALGQWKPTGPVLDWNYLMDLNRRMAEALKAENVAEGFSYAIALMQSAGLFAA